MHFRQQFEKSEWKRSHRVSNTRGETKPVAQPYMGKRPPTATLTREHYEALQPDATSSPMLNSMHSDSAFQSGEYHEQPNVSQSLRLANAAQMNLNSSNDIPRFHPYQRRRSTLPSHGQMQALGERISNNSTHGYNGYSSSMEQSYPQMNANWHTGDQSDVRNNTALEHSVPETHRPIFQRIKLSSKFLK